MPWLTGTAFLHSVMMQEKRGMMKIVECLADLLDVPADDPGNAADPVRHCQQRPCLRAVIDRELVLRVHPHRLRRLPVHLLQAERPPEERKQTGVARQP